MVKTIKKQTKVLLILILAMSFSQSFAQYSINKYSINSGGGKTTGGSYEINASIGQTDASNTMTGGSYSINSGFWHKNNDLIYKNGFE